MLPYRYCVFVGEDESDLEPVYKPNKSRFRADRNKQTVDEISKMSYFDITIDGELYALGWYGNCGWYGFLSDRELSGFRIRKGNILIGDSKTMNGIFKEARFNGWTQGEIFIVTDKLVPNARRDDFEQNEAYYQLIDALSTGVAADIAKAIREASQNRNDPSMKVLREVDKKVSEANAIVAEGFNSSVDKDQLVEELAATVEKLEKVRVKDEFAPKKEELKKKLEETVEQVSESKNYKINKISSGIDKKSKNVLKVVSDILSKKLSKFLVDEIIDEIKNKEILEERLINIKEDNELKAELIASVERAKGRVNKDESFIYIDDNKGWYDWAAVINLFNKNPGLNEYAYDNFPIKVYSKPQ